MASTYNNKMGYASRILPYIEQGNLYDNINFSGDHTSNMAIATNRVAGFLCPSSAEEFSSSADEVVNGKKCYTIHYMGNTGPIGTNPMTGQQYPRKTDKEGSYGKVADGGIMTTETCHRMADVTDGTSNTYAFGEMSWNKHQGYRAWHRGRVWTGGSAAYITSKNHEWPINIGKQTNSSTYTSIKNSGPYGSEHPGGAMFAMCDGSIRFLSETINQSLYLSLASRAGGEVASQP
jgi:prepilin-type processing-associated H-X9-DG protein